MCEKKVSEKLCVIANTERLYLFNPHTNPLNNCKEYFQSYIERLKLIIASRALCFTVDDITTTIAKAEYHKSPYPSMRNIIEKHLEERECQFQCVIVLLARMTVAIAQWENIPDRVPNGHMICHMIESFSEGLNHDASN